MLKSTSIRFSFRVDLSLNDEHKVVAIAQIVQIQSGSSEAQNKWGNARVRNCLKVISKSLRQV